MESGADLLVRSRPPGRLVGWRKLSGVVEGLNNKAKVTMRKSYGFRTFRCLELALYRSLAKLPEPEPTHDFF